jgi:hypothetical protein
MDKEIFGQGSLYKMLVCISVLEKRQHVGVAVLCEKACCLGMNSPSNGGLALEITYCFVAKKPSKPPLPFEMAVACWFDHTKEASKHASMGSFEESSKKELMTALLNIGACRSDETEDVSKIAR